MALAVSVANVSQKRGMSGKSLCRGSEILELVRMSHSWSSSVEVDGLWCSDGHILHLCVHPLNIAFVGGVDPFFGYL